MNKTILIIDDDDILRNTLAKGLRGAGFDVLGADSAEEGAKILKKIRPNAIVLDRMMTGMDGLAFLKSMRDAGDATSVIMLTALSGADNAISGLTGGADDYLAKPFKLQELILRLNNILKGNSIGAVGLPAGLVLVDGEFFVSSSTGADNQPHMLALSGEEKKLLERLVAPLGNTAPASPMVAKRLRAKLNGVLSDTDIVTIRGKGYKLIQTRMP